jgi:hypothetical protein
VTEKKKSKPTGLTYDTSALLAAEADNAHLLSLHALALAEEVRPVVPAVVLAQAWRGSSRQPRLARLLEGCLIEPFDEISGRQVGAALAATRTQNIVDATLILGALARGDAVVTSEPRSLTRLATSLGGRLSLCVI